MQCLFWRRVEVKRHIQSDLCIHVYDKSRILFRHMTLMITLKILVFPFLPLLFMLGVVLAHGMKDVDGVLDLQAFSIAEQADQLLFHLLLGQQIFIYLFIFSMRYRSIFGIGSSCDLTEPGSLRKR